MLQVVVMALVLAPLPAQSRDECRYTATRAADMSASGINLLDLEAGAGSLRVEGRAGLTTIRVRGQACASSQSLLDEVTLTARRTGSTYEVLTDGPDQVRNREYARMDLVIEVPASMAANITDGSGSVTVAGLRSLTVDDGSGELQISGITNGVRIEDGSGEIEISDVTGNVDIDDGSGEITLREIRGTVTIRDGSGSIDARNVTGSVRVLDDGSGSIEVDRVGGDLVVDSGSRGDIHHSGVKGEVRIPTRRRR
jgi:hypothetical protein